MKKYIDIYDVTKKNVDLNLYNSSVSFIDVGQTNASKIPLKVYSEFHESYATASSSSLDIGDAAGVVLSTSRFRRASFQGAGLRTTPDSRFFDSDPVNLSFGYLYADANYDLDSNAWVERFIHEGAPASVHYLDKLPTENGEKFVRIFLTFDVTDPRYADINRLSTDFRNISIGSVQDYDLYLFKNMSLTPWKNVVSSGIRWLLPLNKDHSELSKGGANELVVDWIVAIDHSTLVGTLTGLPHSHGKLRKLYPVNSYLKEGSPIFGIPNHGYVRSIRSILYEIVTQQKIDRLKPLLYSTRKSEKVKDYYPIPNGKVPTQVLLSRHVLHPDNQRAVNLVYEYIVQAHNELIAQHKLIVRKESFSEENLILENIVVEFPGTTSEIFYLGAHIDSTASDSDNYDPRKDPAPGMHDNASGIIACLTCIDAFAKLILDNVSSINPLVSTLRIVLFNAEEVGLVGSQFHVRKAVENGDVIIGGYFMDMIGHKGISGDKGRLVELHWGSSFNKRLESASKSLADIFAHVAPEVSPLVSFEHFGGLKKDEAENRSDHASFHHWNIPALNAGHDFFPFGSGDGNYHTENDTDFNSEYCANVARGVAASAWGIATLDSYRSSPNDNEHDHNSMPVGNEHGGYHAMIIVGEDEVFLCHMINMSRAAHHYHYILSVSLDEMGMESYLALKQEWENNVHRLDESLIVGNLLPFTLSDIILGRITTYEAGIWSAKLPDNFVIGMGWPWAEEEPLVRIQVKVNRVVHYRRFSSTDSYPDRLTYILFGTENEAFLQHNLTKQPDFDHIVQITPPRHLDSDFVALANTVRVAGLSERLDGKLRCVPPINDGDIQITLEFDFSGRAVTTSVVRNIWFSTAVANIGYDGEIC